MKTSFGAKAGERGEALQMRSWGSRGGSFMYDHVYVSDRLWNGALLRGCAAPGPFICDWLVWSCVMVPSALCCFSFFTYKHRSQRLREDELCFVIFTYTLAQKSGQVGKGWKYIQVLFQSSLPTPFRLPVFPYAQVNACSYLSKPAGKTIKEGPPSPFLPTSNQRVKRFAQMCGRWLLLQRGGFFVTEPILN